MNAIRENRLETLRHSSFYLSAGEPGNPLIIMTHGWPELSLSWRHQLPFLASLGFHVVAPDMRGYGRSTVYNQHEDYRLELVVQDMLELQDHLGADKAIWIGHDWGSPVAWCMASHHPDRCHAVASLCVPYGLEKGLDYVIGFVDREVYPAETFPAGQWEYMRFYEENFDKASAPMDANPYTLMKAIFRKGSPDGFRQPSATAFVRQQGGWFGGASEAPDLPIDNDVITEEELEVYVKHLKQNGFFGPNSWYMNHKANADYAAQAVNDGKIDMPALFLAARYDYTCESVTSRLAEPMRQLCADLTEEIIDSGHWMAQEQPQAVNRALEEWLTRTADIL
ncbi:MAG: alpha/beta hydrolase, partial [Gammaproteobacteria bacterium]|nr:alpha/beta hydrolase [Gammaproteobacteria bacterium]